MNTDLSIGKPFNVLLKYSLPLLGSSIFQQLYTIMDNVIAGKFAGESALASVGASAAIINILMAFAWGANAGCSVLISRYFGAKQNDRVKSAINTSFVAFSALAVFLTIVGLVCSEPLLRLLQTPESIMADSVLYLNIYIYGLLFLFLYNLGTGVFSALGDSKTPFYFLIFSSVTNVVLDYVFVRFCGWGVAGVAWATLIAQGSSCILTLICLLIRVRKIEVEPTKKIQIFSFQLLKFILWVSIPVILQNSFVSVGNIFIQGKINGYGTATMAGFTAGFRILILCTSCMLAVSNGLSNYVSQNIGAGKKERVRSGFYSALIITYTITILISAIYLIFAEGLVGLFLDASSVEAISIGALFVRITSAFFIVVNLKIVADAVVRGAGGTVGFMVSTFVDLILRVIFAYVLANIFGSVGIWWSWPLGWVIGTIVAVIFYLTLPVIRQTSKKNLKKQAEMEQQLLQKATESET